MAPRVDTKKCWETLLCFSAMGRLVPDPSVCVLDLQQVINQFCKEKGSHDLWSLLAPEPSKKVTWKTAPDPEWLHKISPFLIKLVSVVKNLVVASKKLKTAMVKIQPQEVSFNRTFFLFQPKFLFFFTGFPCCVCFPLAHQFKGPLSKDWTIQRWRMNNFLTSWTNTFV